MHDLLIIARMELTLAFLSVVRIMNVKLSTSSTSRYFPGKRLQNVTILFSE